VTMDVVQRLHEYRGLSARHITVSTVGVAPAIERMAKTGLPLPRRQPPLGEQRVAQPLVPLNRRYPLERLHEACLFWMNTTGRRLSFEWALIDGVNDRDSDIEELARYASSLRAHVNLIPSTRRPVTWCEDPPVNGSMTFARASSLVASTPRCATRAVDRSTPPAVSWPRSPTRATNRSRCDRLRSLSAPERWAPAHQHDHADDAGDAAGHDGELRRGVVGDDAGLDVTKARTSGDDGIWIDEIRLRNSSVIAFCKIVLRSTSR